MNTLVQWGLTNLILFALFATLFFYLRRANTRKVEELAERLKPEALAHGWNVATELSGRERTVRWTGTEQDVRWKAEDIFRKHPKSSSKNRGLSVTRWHSIGLRGTSAPVLLMGLPEGTEVPKAQPPPEGMFGALAMKAVYFALDKTLDLYFGDQIGQSVDAGALKRVERYEEQVPGFAVMAQNPADAANLFSRGLAEVIANHFSSAPESMQGYRRPWILFLPDGVVMARMGEAESAAALAPLVRAGVAITRAVRF
ncbi:MAG TPA: hypothetical protein VNJ02_17495 [Vicinamibacterales bacterium]|nr:hypothetical protein [Vicinamibacterales bacterium]